MQNKVEKDKNAQLFIAIIALVSYFFIFIAPLMSKNENSSFTCSAALYYTATLIPYFAFLAYFIAVFKKIKHIRCILFPICAFILYFGALFVIPGGGAAVWLIVFTILPFSGILIAIFLTSLGFDIIEKIHKNKYIQKPTANDKQINYVKPVKVSVELKICPLCGEVIPQGYDKCLRGCESANKNMSTNINSISLSKELKKFNWGAFGCTWIWGIGNNVPVAMIGIVFSSFVFIDPPVIIILSIPFSIWLGKKGNELAWASGKYTNIKKFRADQQKWSVAGLITIWILLIILVNSEFIPFFYKHLKF